MIGWIINEKNPRNYGEIEYGKELVPSGSKFIGQLNALDGFYLTFNAEKVSGQLIEQDNLSIGLIGVSGASVPYLRWGNKLFKPDNRFSKEKALWGVGLKKEEFADKDYTISFYDGDTLIYSNGSDFIPLSGHTIFSLTNGLSEIKLYNEKISDDLNSNRWFNLFGASGTLGSGIPLFLGTPSIPVNNSFNITIGAVDSCYLLDEQGNILLDEFGSGILAEGCVQTYGFFTSFDMYISGNNSMTASMPLYLAQNETSVALSGNMPLYIVGQNYLNTSGINLTLYNTYSGLGSGVNLFIGTDDGNDGFIPINNSMPLYIQRGDTGQFSVGQFDMFISGGNTSISGQVDLVLQATQTPISGGSNLSIPYVSDFAESGLNLYTAGY